MCIAKDTIISVRRPTVNPKKVPGDQKKVQYGDIKKFLQTYKEKDKLRGKNNGK